MEGPADLVQGVRAELSPLVTERPPPPDPDMRLNVRSSRVLKGTVPKETESLSLRMNPHARLYPSFEISIPISLDPLRVAVTVDEDRYRYRPSNWTDALANMVWKVLDRSWMSRLDQLTYSLINSVIEPLGLFFLPEKIPLVHSAGIAFNGTGFLLSGSGGTGKTTIATRILEANKRASFLNDDMATTDASGKVHLYPRKVLVYRYNVENNAYINRRLKRQQSVSDRIHWNLHWSKNTRKMARRRISASSLFGREKVCGKPVSIGAVFYFERGEELSLSQSTPEDFARRMAAMMVQEEYVEISRFLFKTCLVEAEWRDSYTKAITSRFIRSRAAIINVSIPPDVDYGNLSLRVMDRMKEVAERRKKIG